MLCFSFCRRLPSETCSLSCALGQRRAVRFGGDKSIELFAHFKPELSIWIWRFELCMSKKKQSTFQDLSRILFSYLSLRQFCPFVAVRLRTDDFCLAQFRKQYGFWGVQVEVAGRYCDVQNIPRRLPSKRYWNKIHCS